MVYVKFRICGKILLYERIAACVLLKNRYEKSAANFYALIS